MVTGFVYGALVFYLLAVLLLMDAIESSDAIDDEDKQGAMFYAIVWPWEAVVVVFHKITNGRYYKDEE